MCAAKPRLGLLMYRSAGPGANFMPRTPDLTVRPIPCRPSGSLDPARGSPALRRARCAVVVTSCRPGTYRKFTTTTTKDTTSAIGQVAAQETCGR